MGLAVRWVWPHAGDDAGVRCVAVAERRGVGRDIMAGSVYRVNIHGGVEHRHAWPVLKVGRDRLVGEVLDEHRLPVVLEPARDQAVEQGVERRVGHRPEELGYWLRDIAEALEHLGARAVVA